MADDHCCARLMLTAEMITNRTAEKVKKNLFFMAFNFGYTITANKMQIKLMGVVKDFIFVDESTPTIRTN